MSILENVFIGLYNPKSPSNVGAVIRAAGCYQASEIRYTGERLDRAAKFQTDTKNIKSKLPLRRVDNLSEELPERMNLICVELVEGATPLPLFKHPLHAMYVFGPEDGSLPQALVDKADRVVFVPTIGCMNLAASVNVLLYDRLAKSEMDFQNGSIVRGSRDTNNRLKLR